MTNPNGRFGIHGGQYIPETLMNAVKELEEAYNHYQRHYDLFFLIEDFSNQNKALTEEIKSYGLLDEVNGKLYLKDLSIKEVYEVMQCVK